MSKQLHGPKEQDVKPDLDRRHLGVGLLAALGGGLAVAGTAQAFPRGAKGEFNAASRILERYGMTVHGAFDPSVNPGHDVLTTRIAQQPVTEYRSVIGTYHRARGLVPCVKTSVFEGDASFTHFHPGEIIPCLKTTIERHSVATHELFDASLGGIIPCIRVVSEMLDGGRLGAIEVTVNDPGEDFSVRVGDRLYRLVEGQLVDQPR